MRRRAQSNPKGRNLAATIDRWIVISRGIPSKAGAEIEARQLRARGIAARIVHTKSTSGRINDWHIYVKKSQGDAADQVYKHIRHHNPKKTTLQKTLTKWQADYFKDRLKVRGIRASIESDRDGVYTLSVPAAQAAAARKAMYDFHRGINPAKQLKPIGPKFRAGAHTVQILRERRSGRLFAKVSQGK